MFLSNRRKVGLTSNKISRKFVKSILSISKASGFCHRTGITAFSSYLLYLQSFPIFNNKTYITSKQKSIINNNKNKNCIIKLITLWTINCHPFSYQLRIQLHYSLPWRAAWIYTVNHSFDLQTIKCFSWRNLKFASLATPSVVWIIINNWMRV